MPQRCSMHGRHSHLFAGGGRGGKREKEGNRNSHSTERVRVREKKKAVIVQLHAPRRETMSNIQRDRSNVQSARNHARDDEHDWNG
eukprot:COSAG02_NODE_6716_length_3403_cov_2.549334_4_plen_86_part_00